MFAQIEIGEFHLGVDFYGAKSKMCFTMGKLQYQWSAYWSRLVLTGHGILFGWWEINEVEEV